MSEPVPVPESIIEPGFKSELKPPVFELGQKTSWTLPKTTSEGTTIKFAPDHQIASLFRFDAATRTITFDGQNF